MLPRWLCLFDLAHKARSAVANRLRLREMPWTEGNGWVMWRPRHDDGDAQAVAAVRNREINVWKGRRRSTPIAARSTLVECCDCMVDAFGALRGHRWPPIAAVKVNAMPLFVQGHRLYGPSLRTTRLGRGVA